MKRKRIIVLMLTWMLLLSLSGCGNKEEGNPFDFSGIETKDLNPWNYMENMELSMSEPLKNLGASSAELGITIGRNCFFYILYGIAYLFFKKCCYKRRGKTGGSPERDDRNYVVQHSILAWAI